MLAFQLALAASATAAIPANTTLTNGVISVVLGAGGMLSLVEDKAKHVMPGQKVVSLAIQNDGWSATVRAGNTSSTSPAEPWSNRDYAVTTTAQPGVDVTLSASTCTSHGTIKRYGRYGLCAGVFWSCASGYTVEVRYDIGDGPPRSTAVKGSYVTKTLHIASSSAATAEFVVTGVTPWQGLGVSAAGATKADWLPFKNGFNGPLEIAGFVRWGELNRGMFVTIQNPFSKFTNGVAPRAPSAPCPTKLKGKNHVGDDLPLSGPTGISGLSIQACQKRCAGITECAGYVYLDDCAGNTETCYLKKKANPTSENACSCLAAKPFSPIPLPPAPAPSPDTPPPPPPGGVRLTATYTAGVAQNTGAFNPTAYVSDGATLGLTALSAYTHAGTELNTGEYQAFTSCVEDFLLDTAAREHKTVKVNVAWDEK
jgi:hypothetical protein